ncbi:hypothetical protein F5884DRAFT_708792 [Xylogone sp. PMI_703]|nr:hypothetical protein F5884DRAFT_708792 [Xylogone sp. PMI_703]
MPFKSDLAVAFIDELVKYTDWHSTTEILRNPPSTYLGPSVDIYGGLSSIRSKAAANQYTSQYAFDSDIANLVSSANDGHFQYQGCSMAVIGFATHTSLVSVSTDGVSIPAIYTLNDGEALGNGAKNVSPVTLINGVGAEAYIEHLSALTGLQDPDARYNNQFANVPIDAQGNSLAGGFTQFALFPGVTGFNLTYANGTQQHIPLQGGLLSSDFKSTTGEELFEAACIPQPPSDSDAGSSSTPAIASPLKPPRNYPEPVVRDPYNTAVGYFPSDTGMEDVAVLTVPTFQTGNTALGSAFTPQNETVTFAVSAQQFVNQAVAAGKNKIVIDLTNNPGGNVDSGFALLSVFFPNMTIFSATRFRVSNSTEYLTRVFSADNTPINSELDLVFYAGGQVKPDQETQFSSLNEFLGPYDVLGVPSTAIAAEEAFTLIAGSANPINTEGLGGPLNGTKAPFAPENIILLTDSRCSSTCTIFSNHMIGKGVRTVTFGGRPQPGPIQSIGGVKGSQALELPAIDEVLQDAEVAVANATALGQPIFTDAESAIYNKTVAVTSDKLPFTLPFFGVNFKNAFAPNNYDVPTHFIYEAADCRLFYTPASLQKPQLNWAAAANAMWGNGKCVFRKPSSPTTSTSSGGSARKALGLLLALARGM